MLSSACFMVLSKFFKIKAQMRRGVPEKQWSFSNLEMLREVSNGNNGVNYSTNLNAHFRKYPSKTAFSCSNMFIYAQTKVRLQDKT